MASGAVVASNASAVLGSSSVSSSALTAVAEGGDDHMSQLMGRRQKLPVPKADTEGI